MYTKGRKVIIVHTSQMITTLWLLSITEDLYLCLSPPCRDHMIVLACRQIHKYLRQQILQPMYLDMYIQLLAMPQLSLNNQVNLYSCRLNKYRTFNSNGVYIKPAFMTWPTKIKHVTAKKLPFSSLFYHNLLSVETNVSKSLPPLWTFFCNLQKWHTAFRTEIINQNINENITQCNLHLHG